MLKFIEAHFPQLRYEYHEDYLYIISSVTQRKIYVDHDYTFRFETQHMHFEDKDKLLSCINGFVNEEVAAIELYKDGQPVFGGTISAEDCDNISPEAFAKCFGYSVSYLQGMNFEIKSWNGKYDAEGVIENSAISIK